MATTRQRRAGATPPLYNAGAEEDRVYTEEDYAMPAAPDEWEDAQDVYAGAGWTGENFIPDESFQPDGEDFPAGDEWAEDMRPEQSAYQPYFTDDVDFTEDLDPLSDELLTDEERRELKRSHWQLIAGLADFAGVILGTAAILVLVTLLVSLLNWLINDVSQSFILLQKHL